MTKTIKASELTLFESLIEFDFDGNHYDLHNTFACDNISYNASELELLFTHVDQTTTFSITLKGCDIAKLNIDFTESDTQIVIDSLYRGRYELEGEVHELKDDVQAYLYIDFVGGYSIECYCTTILISIANTD